MLHNTKLFFKTWFNEYWSLFKEYQEQLKFGFSLIILLSLFANYCATLTYNVNHKAIIFSNDNDAGRGINTTMQSTWYGSNGFHPYGNVYYRFANSIQEFSPHEFNRESLNELENDERSHHFSTMLASTFAIFLLGLFVSSLITADWSLRFLLTCIIVPSFLNNPTWMRYVLKTHPDMLLVLFVAFASYWSYKLITEPDNKKNYYLAAAFWGIATATKTVTVMFAPAILLIMLPPFSINQFKKLFKFILIMFICYIAIGFPQHLNIFPVIKFLMAQSRYNSSPTMGTFLNWIQMFSAHLALPIITLVPLTLIFNDKKIIWTKKNFIRLLMFAILPIAFICSRAILNSNDRYPMPFVINFLIISILFLKYFNFGSKLRYWHKWFIAISGIYIINFYVGLIPTQTMANTINKQNRCRTMAKTVYEKVRSHQQAGHKVMLDPYIPYQSDLHELRVYKWGLEMEMFNQNPDIKLIALKKSFHKRFIKKKAPKHLKKHKGKRWAKNHAFYKHFDGKSYVKMPNGKIWKRVYKDECTFQMWEQSI